MNISPPSSGIAKAPKANYEPVKVP